MPPPLGLESPFDVFKKCFKMAARALPAKWVFHCCTCFSYKSSMIFQKPFFSSSNFRSNRRLVQGCCKSVFGQKCFSLLWGFKFFQKWTFFVPKWTHFGCSNMCQCSVWAFFAPSILSSFLILFWVVIFDALALGGSQSFYFWHSPCRPLHTFSTERFLEKQHFWVRYRILAAEVLQQKKNVNTSNARVSFLVDFASGCSEGLVFWGVSKTKGLVTFFFTSFHLL